MSEPTEVVEAAALIIQQHDTPMPLFSGKQMAEAFLAYRDLQKALDAAMPDAIMDIRGKKFRKKQYWRAVRAAFNLSVICSGERREAGEDDSGWLVTYRATAPSGRSADGDGACFASEKKGRSGDISATEHNVRSHAHTRAFNRAVSNLVGFGEVSAEEVQESDRPAQTQADVATQQQCPPGTTRITSVESKAVSGNRLQFTVSTSDGRSGTTLSKQLATLAEQCQADGSIMEAEFEQKGRWTNLVGLCRYDPSEGSPTFSSGEPQEEDIPF